jgi:hypothetical protein
MAWLEHHHSKVLLPSRTALILTLIGLGCGCNGSPAVPPALANPGAVLSITLKTAEPGAEKEVVIENREAIAALISLATFQRKPPCACAHLESLDFRTRQGSLTASICDHCFNLYEGGKCTNYQMSPAFYARCRELLAGGR